MLNLDEATLGIFKILNADATLQSAAYLNGAGKIFKGVMAADGVNLPIMVMHEYPVMLEGEQSQISILELRLILHLAAHVSSEANKKRAALIGGRIADLVHQKRIVSDGVAARCYAKLGPHPLRVIDGSPTPKENTFIFTYEVSAGRI